MYSFDIVTCFLVCPSGGVAKEVLDMSAGKMDVTTRKYKTEFHADFQLAAGVGKLGPLLYGKLVLLALFATADTQELEGDQRLVTETIGGVKFLEARHAGSNREVYNASHIRISSQIHQHIT
jgi:hypothetical protein